jgi:GNAT superfamily N-acetyltransferase
MFITVNEDTGLAIGPATSELGSAAVDSGWLDDETENRQQGFGKGYDGRCEAREALAQVWDREDSEQNFGLIGVYQESEPVGFVAVDLKDDKTKVADLYVFIAPEQRRQGIGTEILDYMLSTIYNAGYYRVEVDILRINKGGVSFLRENGFTWESTKKAALWMDNNVYDVAHLRMLRPAWLERQKEE